MYWKHTISAPKSRFHHILNYRPQPTRPRFSCCPRWETGAARPWLTFLPIPCGRNRATRSKNNNEFNLIVVSYYISIPKEPRREKRQDSRLCAASIFRVLISSAAFRIGKIHFLQNGRYVAFSLSLIDDHCRRTPEIGQPTSWGETNKSFLSAYFSSPRGPIFSINSNGKLFSLIFISIPSIFKQFWTRCVGTRNMTVWFG